MIFICFLLLSCSTTYKSLKNLRSDFTPEEKKIINSAREVIKNAKYGTLITVDKKGQPRSRIMDALFPDDKFEIWLATNPKSRKVNQILNNSNVTMYYWDESHNAYVSLMGKATIINDDEIKSNKWKPEWSKFYKNKNEDVMLIHFIPEILEMINVSQGYDGDKKTWEPHQVRLR